MHFASVLKVILSTIIGFCFLQIFIVHFFLSLSLTSTIRFHKFCTFVSFSLNLSTINISKCSHAHPIIHAYIYTHTHVLTSQIQIIRVLHFRRKNEFKHIYLHSCFMSVHTWHVHYNSPHSTTKKTIFFDFHFKSFCVHLIFLFIEFLNLCQKINISLFFCVYVSIEN